MTDSLAPSTEPNTAASVAPPIRGLRTMAIVRWILLAAVATVAAGSWWFLVIHVPPAVTGEAAYYCPMHPQITSPVPGQCPICFMTLEPIPAERRGGAVPEEEAVEEPAALPPGAMPLSMAPVMLATERRQTSGLRVEPVRESQRGGERVWPAVIEAREGARAEVRVRASAFVERTQVRESGARVRRGQVLAWVYSPDVLAAQEELLAAHRWPGDLGEPGEPHAPHPAQAAAVHRLELLGVSRADIDAVLASGTTRRTLALRAPIAGTITRVEAVVGTYAAPSDVLYEITDYAVVRVVASALGELDVALGEGATAELTRRGAPTPVPLELELVEPTTDSTARAARVRFLAHNADGALRPGDIGEVTVHMPPRSALVVSRDAVLDRGTERYVFVERGDGLFEPRVVEAGALIGELREIVRGLAAGERVVVRGGFVLDSESRLSAALAPVTDADASPPPHVHMPADEHGAMP